MSNHFKIALFTTFFTTLLIPKQARADDSLRVLPEKINGIEPRDTVQQYLRSKVAESFAQWRKDYEARTTPGQIADYQKRLRAKFFEALGPMPKRTPLNARVVGTIQRDGFTIEKILFESQPKHYVTAALFLPDAKQFKPPYPAVLFPCGHTKSAKAGDAYQRAPSLLAQHGMAALCFDPIGQGERMQLLDDKGTPRHWGTREHTMLGVGAMLLGRNTATYEVWDGMRCLDYLETRKDIDKDRFGCMGVSGGGTQTSYLMVLDDRVKVAAPACYITSFEQLITDLGPQDAEQNIAGQLAFGMDHADYLMMRAPMPTLVCAATHDFFPIAGTWRSYRYAKRLYTRMDQGEKLAIVENDAKHNYNQQLREASVHWMQRWLLGVDEPVHEREIKLLPEKELWCTPRGQTMLLEGARSVYDMNIELAQQFKKQRAGRWKEADNAEQLRAKVRGVTGIRRAKAIWRGSIHPPDWDYHVAKNVAKEIMFHETKALPFATVGFASKIERGKLGVLILPDDGVAEQLKKGSLAWKLHATGWHVTVADLLNMGESKPRSAFKDAFTAYLLGESIVAMRAEQILSLARATRAATGFDGPIDLIAHGDACIPALHAAALEPKLFRKVKLIDGLESWTSLIEKKWIDGHLMNVVHGALPTYDLPDLRRLIKEKLQP